MDIKKTLDDIKEWVPESGTNSIRDFIDSQLHKDFKNEILVRVEQMRDYYEDCKSNEYLETRGGIRALRLVLHIFEDLHNVAIADLESKTNEENDDEEELYE